MQREDAVRPEMPPETGECGKLIVNGEERLEATKRHDCQAKPTRGKIERPHVSQFETQLFGKAPCGRLFSGDCKHGGRCVNAGNGNSCFGQGQSDAARSNPHLKYFASNAMREAEIERSIAVIMDRSSLLIES